MHPIDAYLFALKAHGDQKYGDGSPYWHHLVRVASVFTDDPTAQIVALLHDVVEDTNVTLVKIACVFGEEVAQAVADLTHMPGEPYLAGYIRRVRLNPISRRVKLADIADNLYHIENETPEIKARYARKEHLYHRALDIL